jgi:hypothetical protein
LVFFNLAGINLAGLSREIVAIERDGWAGCAVVWIAAAT